MTLGPTILAVPLLERARGAMVDILVVFGRAPFLYYVLPIPLIHATAVLLSTARYGSVVPWLTLNHPMAVGRRVRPDGGTGFPWCTR